VLTADDYVLHTKVLFSEGCLNGFQEMALPARMGKTMIMGDVFIRKWITQFDLDNNKVGFAEKVK
jgi:cathepsin D